MSNTRTATRTRGSTRTRSRTRKRPTRPRHEPQPWRTIMIAAAVAIAVLTLVAAILINYPSGRGAGGNAANAGAAGTAANRPTGGACLAGQACASALPYEQPDFLAVVLPRLEAATHRTEAQLVAAITNGTSLTQIAAQAGLDTDQWHRAEADAFGAGMDALIAKNEITVPSLASHPDVTTPQQYRDYLVNEARTTGVDFELYIALGISPLQMPGLAPQPQNGSN